MKASAGLGGLTRRVPPQLSAAARRVGRRILTRGTFSLGDRILTINRDGHRLYLSQHDLSLTPVILSRRLYEPGTTRYLSRTIRPGFRVLEIGANIGWHTLMAAERVGTLGKVLAYEPNPQSFSLLHDSVFINGLSDRCYLHEAAVGAENTTATLFTPGEFVGGARLFPFSEEELSWQHQTATTSTVKVVSLNEVYRQFGPVDLIKMDVEGGEADVLAGGKDCLAACHSLTIVFEFARVLHGPGLLETFESQGFMLHLINRLGMVHRITAEEAAHLPGVRDLAAIRGITGSHRRP